MTSSADQVKLKPLFMWAGGKSRLIDRYKTLWPAPSNFDNYVEPFFGAGAVFCWLESEHPTLNSFIGDINSEIMALLVEIRDHPDAFIRSVTSLVSTYLPLEKPDRKIWYYEQRKKYWAKPTSARLYFLMKTGFNGIWQTNQQSNGLFATPSGLLNQTKPEQIIDAKLVRTWSKTLASAQIHSGGYDTLKLPTKGRTLIYLDPPYRESFTNYSTGFGDAEQIKLIQWYRDQVAKGHKVIESNRAEIGDTFFEDRLGDIADIHFLDVTYTAGRRKKTDTGYEAKPAREVLIISK